MNKNFSNLLGAVVIAMTASVSLAAPASAGGLFGKHGLIRGSVGNFVSRNVNPIATPILRGATVAVGATAGAAGGALIGAPATGALIGTSVGNGVNRAAAGKQL